MTTSTGHGLGDHFSLITLTNGRGSSSWRQLCGRWQHERKRPYFELEGMSDVSQARGNAAAVWLNHHDTDWSLWVDDDMVVPIEAVDEFCKAALLHADSIDLLSCCYVPKRPACGNMCVLFESNQNVLGLGGGVVPIMGCGFGLVAIKRALFEKIALGLPRVRWEQVGELGWPFFLPLITEYPGDPDGAFRQAGEDFSFCARALCVGGRLACDTRLRVGHRGGYTYHWEDAGQEVQRVDRIDLARKPSALDLRMAKETPPPCST